VLLIPRSEQRTVKLAIGVRAAKAMTFCCDTLRIAKSLQRGRSIRFARCEESKMHANDSANGILEVA
jgi:hypothetical protein